jgi:hypothetical protein
MRYDTGAAHVAIYDLILLAPGIETQRVPVCSRAAQAFRDPLFSACKQAVEGMRASDRRLLTRSFGFLQLHDRIDRFSLAAPRSDADLVALMRHQVEDQELADAWTVLALCPPNYAEVVRTIWPHAECPLDGHRDLDSQLSALSRLEASLRGTPPSE